MPTHPLAEVFGFPTDNLSATVERYRNNRLCPYNNRVPSCTKDKANDPLGVCSIFDGEKPVITCPVRFRRAFFATLPELQEVPPGQAELAWLLYDLEFDPAQNRYQLVHSRTVYTTFDAAIRRITTAEAGPIAAFVEQLQEKLDQQLENGNPPDTLTLADAGLT